MPTESFRVSEIFPVTPEEIYTAWMSSTEHSKFTGSPADIEPVVGGEFTAWDGYISGRTLKLEPPHRIEQAWRTSEFPEESADSLLVILFDEVHEGTQITFVHSFIPEGQGDSYLQGWEDFYFAPMRQYFKG